MRDKITPKTKKEWRSGRTSNNDKIEEIVYSDEEPELEINLIDYEKSPEPDISSLSSLGQAPISEEVWGQYVSV